MSPEKNPFNYNILKGGQVDPTSKLYQRSVSSREKLGEFLSKQWNNGADEADVFMAGVKSLMSRGHGYVGAYLDSKNPGRTYTKNEAMAITDAVMSQENIGDHPGARMTREKGDSDEAKEARAARKEANKARGFGPKQARGPKAMPVGQQRKQPGGRGKGTGVPADPGDRSTNERENLSKPPSGPTSPEWQNVLEKRMKGEATTKDVLDAFKSKYQSKLSDSPENKAKKEEKAKARRDDLRDSIATGGRSTKDTGTTGPEDTGAPEPEETAPQATKVEGRVLTELLGNFDRGYKDARKLLIDNEKRKTKGPWDPKKERYIQPGEDDVKFLIEDSIDSLNEQYGGKLDTKSAKDKLRKLALDKLGFDPYEGEDEGPGDQEAPESKAPAQPEAEPAAEPEAKPPAQPEAKPPAQPGTEAPAQPEAKPPAQPGTEAPAQPEAKPPAQPGTQGPAQPAARKDTGFKPPRQPAPKGSGGFTPSSKEERAKKVKEVVSALPELGKQSLEDFKASLYNFQPSLLGKQGLDTNPDAEPFPAGPEESAPSSDLPGAPSSRPAPPTAKAGQPGQQSMFRADGITPRTGRGFGSNVPKPAAQPEPAPQPAPEPENKGFGKDVQKGKKATPNTPAEKPAGPETYKQGNIFGGRGYETGQAGNPLEDQPADPYAKYRGEPIEPRTVTEPAEAGANKPGQQSMFKSGTTTPRTGKYFGSKPKPSVPERAEGASAKDRLKQLMDSGLTSAQAGRQVIAESGKGPRKNAAQRKAARRKGVSNSAEYQEFAQSIRAMMR